MSTVNRRKDIVASLIAGAMRTIEEGEAAQARALAGIARPGDKRRVEQYLFLADMLAERQTVTTTGQPVTEAVG